MGTDICRIRIALLCMYIFITASCSRFVEVPPPATQLVSEAVYSTNETAISAVTGVYAQMAGLDATYAHGFASLNVFPALSADELACFNDDAVFLPYYTNRLTSVPGLSIDHWRTIYSPTVYLCNVAIQALSNAVTFEQDSKVSFLNENVRKQLLGEMKFVRAFCYFYLVQLYGDVPLLTTPDYIINTTGGRTSKDLVYLKIVEDLKEAQEKLSSNYVNKDVITVGVSRVRPVKGVATALLSRVYLYMKKYAESEKEALSLIENTSLYSLVDLNDIARINNKEAIWQWQVVNEGEGTKEAMAFVLPAEGPDVFFPLHLSPRLIEAFEPGDNRRKLWVGSVTTLNGDIYYYPYKYKVFTANDQERSTVFRLSEQYLICAEARARMGNVAGSDSMLNKIRIRAGLNPLQSINEEAAIKNIFQERRVELFTEWGHRWFDLKRSGLVDDVMKSETPLKGGNAWQSYQQLYPIPNNEIQLALGLQGQQNPGYQ